MTDTDHVPTALIFPGQGSQRHGMGEPWRDTSGWSLVDDISGYVGHDVEELLLKADDETLRRTDLAQLALFTTSVLAHSAFVEAGLPEPAIAYAGHSLGEYVALFAAGALSLEGAARLVAARGAAMREAAEERPGTMAVLIAVDERTAYQLAEATRQTGAGAWVANLNSPGQVVVSGTAEGVATLTGLAQEEGGKVMRIPVGGAFHSPLMAGAAERLRGVLAAADFADRHGTVVANVDARTHQSGEVWPELQVRQLTRPVLWERGVRVLHEELGCRRFVELGPGKVLSGTVRRIARSAEAVPVDSPGALRALRSAPAGRP